MERSKHEVDMIRETARRFGRSRRLPLEEEIETADDVALGILAALHQQAAALGLYGFNLPEPLGGPVPGVDSRLAVLVQTTSTSVPLSELLGHLPMSMAQCSAEQRERFCGDARGFRTGEGASEMQRIQPARHTLQYLHVLQ